LESSEYARFRKLLSGDEDICNKTPEINFDNEIKVCGLLRDLVNSNLLKSAVELSYGGLASALTNSCLTRSKPIGIELESLHNTSIRKDAVLFSESPSRFVISFDKKNQSEIEEKLSELDIPIEAKGLVGGKSIKFSGTIDLNLALSTAYKLWAHRFDNIINQQIRF